MIKQPSAHFRLGPTHHQFPKVNTQSLFVVSFNVFILSPMEGNKNK